jgi:secondary thiamine-phosphate synthase enzyme
MRQTDANYRNVGWNRHGLHVSTKSIMVMTHGDGDVIDITKQVQERIAETGLQNGIVTLFVQGSTAALTTIENEEGLIKDFTDMFERIAPSDTFYKHQEKWRDGNGHSHVRASLLGPSLTVPFTGGYLTLGTWQQLVLMDFDNRPRQREIVAQLMGE